MKKRQRKATLGTHLLLLLSIGFPNVYGAFISSSSSFSFIGSRRLDFHPSISTTTEISRSEIALQAAIATTSSPSIEEATSLSSSVNPVEKRIRTKIRIDHDGKEDEIFIISRTVRLTNNWNVTVYEYDKPATLVEQYWNYKSQKSSFNEEEENNNSRDNFVAKEKSADSDDHEFLDPFGLVVWPGAVIAVQEIQKLFSSPSLLQNKTVLILGAGSGVETIAMAQLGAKHVIATDIHPITLQLIRYSSKQLDLDHIISTQGTLDYLYQPKFTPQFLLTFSLLYCFFVLCRIGFIFRSGITIYRYCHRS